MAFVEPFSKLNKDSVTLAGGKGASLGEMYQAGIPVPNGFVVLSTAFDHFIQKTGLNVEIEAALDNVDIEKMHTVENASETIQELILEATMPEDIASTIMTSFSHLDATFVAVRSSATAEDSSSAAWAGQLDSYLNTTKETLLEHVQKCWASLFTPRAIFYRFEKKLHHEHISVAVVVQKMVESDEAGIAFSVHPVTQDRNQLIIEAGFGLGEAVVSGQITPDSYVVEKDAWNLLEKMVSEQSRKIVKKPRGGNEWIALGAEGSEQVLPDEEVIKLAKLVVKIEQHYGFPVDVEWAREKNKMFIVQSRPITTLTAEEPDNAEVKKKKKKQSR